MLIGGVGTLVMFTLVILGMPVTFALWLIAFLGIWFVKNLTVADAMLVLETQANIYSSSITIIPMFLLLGSFVVGSGMIPVTYEVARRWVGRLPGGLALTSIAASAAFGACSGSSAASSLTIGKLAIPEMKRYGYADKVASGSCAAGGLLATLIPPSGIMIIYAMISEQSPGRMLIAGLIPGITMALLFGFGTFIQAKLDPSNAPVDPKTFTWKERWGSLPQMWGIIVIFSIIFFGIFFGWFTTQESSAFGAFTALVLLVVRRIREGDVWSAFVAAAIDCAQTASTILHMLLGSLAFSIFIILAGLPRELSDFVLGLDMSPLSVLLILLGINIVLGMFLEGMAIMLITVPIFLPIVTGLGYDPIWYGVAVVITLEISLLTPPFGICCYVISGIAPDIPLPTIFRGAAPYIAFAAIVLALIIVFPQIPLWLPSLM
jgi:C4-dicarboxylate transporter DctM subunit